MLTIFMPVCRDEYLDQVFESVNNFIPPFTPVDMVILVDGNESLYRNVLHRDYAFPTKVFKTKLPGKVKKHSPLDRRNRIAKLHNEAKQYVTGQLLVGLEDDQIYPRNFLTKLVENMAEIVESHQFGAVGGISVGRWGAPYIAGWKFDQLTDFHRLESVAYGKGLEKVDATGFYGFLTLTEYWKAVDHQPHDRGQLGPDINFFLELRKQGKEVYINHDLVCDHIDSKGRILKPDTHAKIVKAERVNGIWRQMWF